jgi:hypothetical protein
MNYPQGELANGKIIDLRRYQSSRFLRDAARKYEAIAARLPKDLCSDEIAALRSLAGQLRGRDSSS